MKNKKFKVSGIAFVPIEVEMEVEAIGRGEAVQVAEMEFYKNPTQYIVLNSEDLDAVHSWQPFAEEIPMKVCKECGKEIIKNNKNEYIHVDGSLMLHEIKPK